MIDVLLDGHQRAPEALKRAQKGPKRGPKAPKWLQGSPKNTQQRPKRALKCICSSPRGPTLIRAASWARDEAVLGRFGALGGGAVSMRHTLAGRGSRGISSTPSPWKM